MKIKNIIQRPRTADCILLFAIVLLSALPYVAGLGFYSDEWSTLESFVQYSGHGFVPMIRQLADPSVAIRPVPFAYLVLSFEAFGQNPTPYHIVNSLVLGLSIVLLYLSLSELDTNRSTAFVIALVFSLLPHYSTNRLWIAAHQGTLSMAFAFLGTYALLRSTRPNSNHTKCWIALSIAALILSILSYELFLGYIGLSLAVIAWRAYTIARANSQSILSRLSGVITVTSVLFLLGLLKSRLQDRMAYHHHFFTHLGALTWHLFVQAIQFCLWTYALHMPAVLVRLFKVSALSPTTITVSVIIGFSATAHLLLCSDSPFDSSAIPSRRVSLLLIITGFVLFALGYALFFPSIVTDFSTAGLSNRVALASALGASCVLVAIVSLACSALPSNTARSRAFAVAIGLVCTADCLAVNGIASFWVDAATRQSAILKSVVTHVRSLPNKSTLLLDGFCRFSGPGVVFETDWDTTGAIQLALADPSLTGDVVSPNTHFGETAVETTVYSQPEAHYPYGDHLFVYNVKSQTLTSLLSKQAASEYLRAMNPTGDSGCPAGREGDGTKVF